MTSQSTYVLLALAAASAVVAQRPNDTSICDYYANALLKNNTAESQHTVLTLVVNTAVIGNYTQPNVGVSVPGILAPGEFNGTAVNLLPYFNGELASSNRGGKSGVSVNFLDGGGAAPLKENKPANDTTSNQYFLLTHLYEFFGSLLGCSQVGMAGFPAYDGVSSMYEVHKFMDLDQHELGYFIQQVGMSAASFGVAESDLTVAATALTQLFGARCAPPAVAIAAQGPQLQAICIADSCPQAEGAVCDQYEPAVMPQNATSTGTSSMGTSSTGTATGTATRTATSTSSTSTSTSSSSSGSASFAVVNIGLLVAACFAALSL